MTTTIDRQVERRRTKTRELKTFASDFQAAARARYESRTRVSFPSARYRQDPVAFAREILGVEPWSKQVEILEAVRDHKRVAVRSGHKVSKSHSAAILALWFYCSFPDARVVMTSTTSRQVDQILWRELRMVRARGGRCTTCKAAYVVETPCPHSSLIDGESGDLARTGLKSKDFREVVGFTAREAEAVAGVSGANLLYIVDEASGVDEAIFEAIEGNRAGGARIVLFSNPTRNEGEHYAAFFDKKAFYKTLTVSSEETPNVVQGKDVIPGLATRDWVEEKRQEWGEDSALYKVRVRGEHALHEDGKIFSVGAISAAEERWYEAADAGRLQIGLDPSGASGSGDECVFTPRRGLKAYAHHAFRGLDEQQILIRLLALIQQTKLPKEKPVVVLDREGDIGSKTYYVLRDYVERHSDAFELVAVRASDRSPREPFVYDRMRDALTASLEAWIREGGAISEDAKLAAEMHAFEWKQAPNGRLKCTPKDQIRKQLGRSPDRYDSLCLAVWDSPLTAESTASDADDSIDDLDALAPPRRGRGFYAEDTFDPYG